MRFRVAVIVIFVASLLGCSGAGPTAPKETTQPPVVTPTVPVPEPTETPIRGCSGHNCER
jgi:hypothetical protein